MKKALSMILAIALLLSVAPVWAASAEAAENGLVLHYEMADKGTTVTDSAGDYDGALVGSTSWIAGLNGYALHLSGGEDYISVPTAALKQSDDMTVSMWVRLDKIENWTALLVAGDSAANYAILAAQGTPFGTACGLTMEIYENGANKNRVKADTAKVPVVDEWSLVTYTQSGSTATVYLNGEQVAQSTTMIGTIKGVLETSEDSDVRIGYTRMFADPAMVGAVSEVKIYNRALSASEVQAEANGKNAQKAAEFVRRYVSYILNNGYELPTGETVDQILGVDYNCNIQWKVTSGDAQILNGKLYKTANASEREAITISATITSGGVSETVNFEHVVLMDECVAYILSFFGGDDGAQKLHLAYSYDGINWQKLNDGLTVLPTTVGNGNVRDPFIMRKKDGSFAVVATQGWDTPQIYWWDSNDLVSYTNERLVTVTKEGIVGLTGQRAWAPEASYDPINDRYIVYWADPRADGGDNGVTYANYSTDLETFSDPFILFDPGYKHIDSNIIRWNGMFYLAYKDGDNVKMAKSTSLAPNSFQQYTGQVTETLVEGPFMFKDLYEEKWCLYYDYYNEHKFGVSVTTDLESGEWEFLGKSTTMPTEDVRHGGVITVTQKELDRILDGYAFNETVNSVTQPEGITVPYGTAFADLPLPETVKASTPEAGVKPAPVTWTAGNYNAAAPGTYTLAGTLDKIGTAVTISVTVEGSGLVGDVSGDGRINVADILSLKRVILSGGPTQAQFKICDVNEDGLVNTLDMVALKAIILNSD